VFPVPLPLPKPHEVAHPAAHHAPAPPRKPDPFGLYDSAQWQAIPGGVNQAVYADGAYAAPPSAAKGHLHTLWIDVTGDDPHANVLDVEKYDASPDQAGPWAAEAERDHPDSPTIVYSANDTLHQAEISVAEYHITVKWWVASPTQEPHSVGGADAAQWQWNKNYNVSETNPDFFSGHP